ncbi:sensor domain-containing diguanylate cyclase [Synechococcus sp. RSCCF101]|uniref:sensor domain-containing diguanylate cyclase n=1 Tax=Synechococcus sp. RSCCF101 TaxID=2511069 RepID=UPI0012491D8E|nr:sensor domain-containing diguanylate cyclase [Synechococcus sp. RSCCF101]QEY31294.1 sensor domain-containing diguanylate cyclase [Synechococcus sp. RSCCF101]
MNEAERLNALRRLCVLDTPLEERYERITRMVCQALRVPISAISMVDASRQWFKSIQGLDAAETPREVAFCSHAIKKPEPMVVADAQRDHRFRANPLVTGPPNIRSYAAVPLALERDLRVGTLCAIDRVPRAFSSTEQAILKDLGEVVLSELRSLALTEVNAQLATDLDEARRQALIDPLTRIWNRAGIELALQRAWDEARRHQDVLSIVMVDCDGFKQINDLHGHPCGDAVLRTITRTLLRELRRMDVLGRWGGDEFLIVLPRSALHETERIMARMQNAICGQSIDGSAGPIHCSVTMGAVTMVPGDDDSLSEALRQADDTLIRLKHAIKGSNAVRSLQRPEVA